MVGPVNGLLEVVQRLSQCLNELLWTVLGSQRGAVVALGTDVPDTAHPAFCRQGLGRFSWCVGDVWHQ